MPDVGAALRGRTFGIPNGILLIAVAAGIWYFFIRGKTGAKAGTAQAAAAGSQLESGYGLGFAQGQQAAQASQPTPAPTPTSGPTAPAFGTLVVQGGAAYGGGTYLRTQPDYPFGASIFVPSGTQLQQTGTPVEGYDPNLGRNPMIPVKYLGGQYYASSQDVRSLPGTGVGGGAPIRKHHIGSRSAALHDAHPLIGAPVRYAHYVRVGGPHTAARHRDNINHVAAQAGVHPARVAMLNPVPTGLIRIA